MKLDPIITFIIGLILGISYTGYTWKTRAIETHHAVYNEHTKSLEWRTCK